MKIEIEISNDVIEDILVTAFEGGINYWVDHIEFDGEGWASEWLQQSDTHVLLLHDQDGEQVHELTMSKLLEGIGMAFAQGRSVFDSDGACVDADGADVIIQLALFKEIIYG
ncbi:MAG: hypothetical protein ACK5DE_09985 [Bacteroidota bacterium]|jgi:hypothetical protein